LRSFANMSAPFCSRSITNSRLPVCAASMRQVPPHILLRY
jgi:hypothetical protein